MLAPRARASFRPATSAPKPRAANRVVPQQFKRSIAYRPSALRYPTEDGLSPVISPKAFDVHFNKIQKDHLQRVNELVQATPLHNLCLEGVVAATNKESSSAIIHYHASQAFAHKFFFNCLRPRPNGRVNVPTDYVMQVFDTHFDGFANFKKEFTMHAAALIGNGYTWLVNTDGHLEVMNTYNAQTPLDRRSSYPLLCLDMWEHAYVYDWDNDKTAYVEAFWEIVNWNYVDQLIKQSRNMNHHLTGVPEPDIAFYEAFDLRDDLYAREYHKEALRKEEHAFPEPKQASDKHKTL